MHRNRQEVELTMPKKQNKKKSGNNMLSAIRTGNYNRVKELLNKHGIFSEPSWGGGYILLRESLENKQPAIAHLLIENYANVNSKNTQVSNTPLHFAVQNDYEEIVECILQKGAYVLAQGNPGKAALHIAVDNENVKIVKILLKYGAYVNVTCTLPYQFNYTPLHLAVEKCNEEIVELLLRDEKVDVDAMGSDGLTPLHIAAEKNNETLVKHLIVKGSKVNAAGRNGVTPLHIAAEVGNVKIAELLIKKGANVNATYNSESKAREGFFPLHLAIIRKHEKMVKLLLKYHALLFDLKQRPMVSFAVDKSNTTIVEHLLSYYPEVRGRVTIEENTKIKAEKLPDYGFNVKIEKICSYLSSADIDTLVSCYENEDMPCPKRQRCLNELDEITEEEVLEVSQKNQLEDKKKLKIEGFNQNLKCNQTKDEEMVDMNTQLNSEQTDILYKNKKPSQYNKPLQVKEKVQLEEAFSPNETSTVTAVICKNSQSVEEINPEILVGTTAELVDEDTQLI